MIPVLTHIPLDKTDAILPDDIFKWIFSTENCRIPIQISLKFVARSPVDNNSALAQIIAWHRTDEKPLPEPMMTHLTLENRYGFWPQSGCVTVPGCKAAFLVARQRFPYRSRFNFSVKNMENRLPCNAICDIMHIDFSRKIYCGANDASIGFKSKFIKSNDSSQNMNVRDVLRHFAPNNRSYWECINWNAHELFSKGEEW